MAKVYRSEDKTVLLEVFGAGSSIENLKSLKIQSHPDRSRCHSFFQRSLSRRHR